MVWQIFSYLHYHPYPRVEQGLVHVTDWFPPLLSAAGARPTDTDLDGVDQWARLRDPTLAEPRHRGLTYYRHGREA